MNEPTSTAFATVPTPGVPPSDHAIAEHDDRDGDVRHPERERRVLRDSLVQHVPGREPELRLENEHDREREQEEAEDEARVPRGVAAANARMRLR